MTAVFDHSRSRLADRLVLLVIADRAHDDGTGCYRSRDSIAQMAGVSPRQVTESIRRLRDMGELEVIERPGTSNLYRVTLAGSSTPLAESATPPSRICQTPLAGSATNPSIDPSSKTLVESDFDLWWSKWPLKKERTKAYERYRSQRKAGAPTADLLTARDHYLAQLKDPTYCKYGATFLSPSTWKDYLEPVATTNGHGRVDFDRLAKQ